MVLSNLMIREGTRRCNSGCLVTILRTEPASSDRGQVGRTATSTTVSPQHIFLDFSAHLPSGSQHDGRSY
ncbi:uncharacterized protein BO87DRAFT_438821 [Aspergillus neoniger CBS 115656]|uniref:Uncharacterized protein n=1 Tax=Aspergillus neoniger (strain CBS 115656) TaxID=1448310 RepID=A0A318YFN4_ASPNB|nr:hypothetical protein BO87DRAFT_438821 [Aspergillus neoniger CBS 115656]PYH33271.1 hypothetical protein BO87DRAFT_438821 [Aspergillus neoniger CBS 115656]